MAIPALLTLPSWRFSLCLFGADERALRAPQRLLNILFLAYAPANLAILLFVPSLASVILPAPLLDATADNGIKGNLLMYVCLFLYNVAILAASASVLSKQLAPQTRATG